MKFCEACDNMLYIQLEDGALQFACKNCGHVSLDAAAEQRVIDTNYADDQSAYLQYVTPYITHDPTLPRVSNIPCPNAACSRPPEASNEVIYVKYDARNLRFLYHCVHCSSFWKSHSAAGADAGAVAADTVPVAADV
jgi:DNA-directed RNA polymerase subunit M/transcription elongation factor TFIIS